jgi:TatA/E family protein of Tat protein translocase
MFNIGPLELMVILIVALLVVGPAKLPELGRSIGRGLREFRKAQAEVQRTLRLSLDDDEEPPSRPMRSASTPAGSNGDAAASGAAAAGTADADTALEPDAGERPDGPRSGSDDVTDARSGSEDVARALGRGLAELRRAKEELQNSFRIDLNDDGGSGDGSRAG